METSYKKLWKQLIDRDMTKTELRMRSGISTMALAKLGKGENVSIEVLKKICATLECDIGDIMEMVPHDKEDAASSGAEE